VLEVLADPTREIEAPEIEAKKIEEKH